MPTIDENLIFLKDKLTLIINTISQLKDEKQRLESAIAEIETVKRSQVNPDFVANLAAEFEDK